MFNASSLNRGSRFTSQIPTGVPFKKVKDLTMGKTYTARLFYINKKSKFGEEPVVVTDEAIVNLPKYMSDLVKDIINNPEAVAAVNEGRFGFKPYEYESKTYGTCYSVSWVDVEPDAE